MLIIARIVNLKIHVIIYTYNKSHLQLSKFMLSLSKLVGGRHGAEVTRAWGR